VSNVAIMNGSFAHTETKLTPPAHRTGLQMPPGMWAKARSQLGALIRLLCGDGAVSSKEIMNKSYSHTE
jgi:hypothetical protein